MKFNISLKVYSKIFIRPKNIPVPKTLSRCLTFTYGSMNIEATSFVKKMPSPRRGTAASFLCIILASISSIVLYTIKKNNQPGFALYLSYYLLLIANYIFHST